MKKRWKAVSGQSGRGKEAEDELTKNIEDQQQRVLSSGGKGFTVEPLGVSSETKYGTRTLTVLCYWEER